MNNQMKEFIAEVRRCMEALMETGEFPPDTCPADIYTLCVELRREEGK
jgi:hypothetical protein